MPSKATQVQALQPEFSLKHRLIGAGILISFGVIILPWMLGSYSAEESVASIQQQDETSPSSIAALATKAASKTTQGESNNNTEEEVSVFISRVQPLNREEEPIKETPTSNNQSEVKAEVVDKTEDTTEKNESKSADSQQDKSNDQQPEQTDDKTEAKKPEVAQAKPAETVVSRGYIVSIGVYGDASNVEKMVADLKSKEFEPGVRKEKFNEKDVSRVYLGPFESRAEAGKVKLNLSEKGIQKTLIKEFP